MGGVEIVDHDQIEVGGRRHLAAAELAKRQDGDLLARHAAVQRGKTVSDRPMQRSDQHVGEAGKSFARLLR